MVHDNLRIPIAAIKFMYLLLYNIAYCVHDAVMCQLHVLFNTMTAFI